MILSAIVAYAHYISIIALGAIILSEALLIKPQLSNKEIKRLARIDMFYGIISVMVLFTGFTRIFHFGKGAEYYFSNSIFIFKLILFGIIGILSIYPTITLFKLNKRVKTQKIEHNELTNYQLIKLIILFEIALYLLIPLMASLMSRGVDI